MLNLRSMIEIAAGRVGADSHTLMAYALEDTIGGQNSHPHVWNYLSLSDIEGRTLYALIRHLKPLQVLEIGVAQGCSSTHILKALRKNGAGVLTSIDTDASAGSRIPLGLRDQWHFYPEDARSKLLTMVTPSAIDFIFEDGAHDYDFSREMIALTRRYNPAVYIAHDTHQYPGVRRAMCEELPFTTYTKAEDSVAGWGLWTADAAHSRVDISVVSGTCNRLSLLKGMVESARKALPYGVTHEFVLVDGGSTDGTLEWCETQKDIRCIPQHELLGAITAFNAGFAHARGHYVVVANDDIVFMPNSIACGYARLQENPAYGAVAFYQRTPQRRDWHVNEAAANGGHGQTAPYLQVGILRRELGDAAEWWTLPHAYTYGGDNALSARLWGMGYPIVPVPEARVDDLMAEDELRQKNRSYEKQPPTGFYPAPGRSSDTISFRAYTGQFPQGIRISDKAQLALSPIEESYRILYAPIFDRAVTTERYKRGLCDALAGVGTVLEVDHQGSGEAILSAAAQWLPHLILLQIHEATRDLADGIRRLREQHPNAAIVNWIGDYWDTALKSATTMEALRYVDLNTVANGALVTLFQERGIPTQYWQAAFEPTSLVEDVPPDTPVHEVVFMGNRYSDKRTEMEKILTSLPYNVGIYGRGWGQAHGDTLYKMHESAKLYKAAKVAIADQQWKSAWGYCSDRTFYIMAAGGAVMCHQRFDGMEQLGIVDGESAYVWDNLSDLPQAVERAMNDSDATRWRIALKAKRVALSQHSYYKRVADLLEMLKGLPAK